MTAEELRQILKQREGLKLDFKQEYKLFSAGSTAPDGLDQNKWREFLEWQWNEFTKDIIGLTNGNIGTADEPGRLVIGALDDKKPLLSDGSRGLLDASYLDLKAPELLERINNACYPPIPDLQCEKVILDGKTLWVIAIPPTPYVHETTRELKVAEKKSYTARTAFIRRGEGTQPATEAERRALAIDKAPQGAFTSTTSRLILDEFSLPSSERERIKAVFARPKRYIEAQEILRQRQMLWIIGPSGVWKRHLALNLALEQGAENVYRVPSFVSWQQLNGTGIADAVIVLPDALGAVRLEKPQVASEFGYLAEIVERRNYVIATTSEDVFEEAAKETRFTEVLPRSSCFRLTPDDYDYGTKVSIFRRLLDQGVSLGLLSDAQRRWGFELVSTSTGEEGKPPSETKVKNREQFRRLARQTWLPADIERFVIEKLPAVHHEAEIFDVLRQDADIDARIHFWFGSLDDSTRCFVFTLTMFAGLDTDELWSRHKEIVSTLIRLDPSLAAIPLGIFRQRAAPHVTQDGLVDFVSARVYQTVAREVAKNYREYFLEIKPLLQKWSIPSALSSVKEERDRQLAESESVRNQIARMVGEVAKFGLDDVKDLLLVWANHPIGGIAKTAGIALRETAADLASTPQVLELLHSWAIDTTSSDGSARFRRWAAGSALWRVGSQPSRFDLADFALQHLQRLAKDPDDYVVSGASYGLRMLARAVPLAEIAPTLTRLAKESEAFTRRQAAFTVDDAAGQNREDAYNLIDVWTSAASKNLHWTAAYTLLTGRNISTHERFARVERYPRLIKLLSVDASAVSSALQAALGDEERQTVAVSIIEALSRPGSEGQPSELVASLAHECMTRPDVRTQLLNSIAVVPFAEGLALKDAVEAEIKARTPAPPPSSPQPAAPVAAEPAPKPVPAKVGGPGCAALVSAALFVLGLVTTLALVGSL